MHLRFRCCGIALGSSRGQHAAGICCRRGERLPGGGCSSRCLLHSASFRMRSLKQPNVNASQDPTAMALRHQNVRGWNTLLTQL